MVGMQRAACGLEQLALTRPMMGAGYVDGHNDHVLREDETLDLLLGRPALHLRRVR